MANDEKEIYAGLKSMKKPREDAERCVTSVRASSKEINNTTVVKQICWDRERITT